MRKPSLKLMSYALIVMITLGACDASSSIDSPDPTQSTSATSSTAEPASVFLANFVAASVEQAADTNLTEQGARCLADGIYDGVGEARLIEVGLSEDGREPVALFDGNVGFTPKERETVADVFSACFDDPFQFLFDAAQEPDRAIADCVIAEVRAAGITLEQLLFAEIEEYEVMVGQAGAAAVQACQIDAAH